MADVSGTPTDPAHRPASGAEPWRLDPPLLPQPEVTGVPGWYGSGRRRSSRAITLRIAIVLAVALGIGFAVLPVPYAIEAPGPSFDTLAKTDTRDLIEITGAPVYPTTGQLRLTTVSVSGGEAYPVSFIDVFRSWLDPTRSVVPVEEVYPPGRSKKETEEASQYQMSSSQQAATVAALRELGYTVPSTLEVAALSEDSPSKGALDEGDVLVSVDGRPLAETTDLTRYLDGIPGGQEVAVSVRRDGQVSEQRIVTGTNPDGGTALLGITVYSNYDLPVEVNIDIDNVGGPSAGMIFALGIIDKLTEQDELNGTIVAGTGTMSVDGTVGSIGGIQQKMVAAATGQERTGTVSENRARWFLAPADNCGDVVGNVPDGLRVVKVATLHEAWEAIIAIGNGTGDSLPTCTAG